MTLHTIAPSAQFRCVALADQPADVEFLGRTEATDLQQTARMCFNEIEDLLDRMHARVSAIQACAVLTTGGAGTSVEINRGQVVALLDLFADNVKLVAYEMQDTVGTSRRLLGLFRSTAN